MTRFERVIAILDQSVGGPEASIGDHGAFWRGLSRDQFVVKKVFSYPLTVIGDGAASTLVKALKGDPPFGSDLPDPSEGARLPRMPYGYDPVPDVDIAFIQKWIDDGCPEDTYVPPPAPARIATLEETAGSVIRWRPTNAPVASSRTDDIWFLDPEVGWAVNSNGHILKTTDGGASWVRQFATGAYLRCVGFADAKHGWVGTLTPSQRLFSTADGGETWTLVGDLPSNAPVRICGLSVVNASVVYAAGTNEPTDPPRMMKTTDGGRTWTAWDMRPWASILIDTHFVDENRGWVVGGKADDASPQDRSGLKPVVLYTEDGGQTWSDRLAGQDADFPFGEWGWKMQLLNDRVGFVSLENFTDAAVLKTMDGGTTWTRLKVDDSQDNANLEGVGFIDESRGWVGGWGDAEFNGGYSSATADGGSTWRDANEIGRFINRFRFFGDPVTVGYASGRTVYKYSGDPMPFADAPAVSAPQPVTALLPEQRMDVTDLPAEFRLNVPPGTARLTLDVWDRFGRYVGAISDEVRPACGMRKVKWDGRDANGRAVGDGPYVFRATADAEAESGMLLLRSLPTRPRGKQVMWIRHDLRVSATSPLRALATLREAAGVAADSAGTVMVHIELPDLSGFPTPAEKADFLLHAAADIEHALLVQYLYAAYSLKKQSAVSDPQHKAAVKRWADSLAQISREEMGHLLTVQNLRLLIGKPVDFQRVDFPQPANLYPFKMRLQPLTQKALATYVVAESPVTAAGIEDILHLATEEAGMMPTRVGILYALLGVVFTEQSELESNAQTGDPWSMMVQELAASAYEQEADRMRWHLPDDAFDPASLARQATDEEWSPSREIRILAAGDRRAALRALCDVALQGEGPVEPTGDPDGSHFQRFLSVYRGGGGLPPFPAGGDWQPALGVPVDPRLEGALDDPNIISEPKAKDFARLADMRYGLLLGFLEQYFLTEATRRAFLTEWCFAEMGALRRLGAILSGLPRGTGEPDAVAALPFSLPDNLHLPPDSPLAQWQVHVDRLSAAIGLARQMLATHSPGNGVLTALVRQDQARLQLAAQAQQGQLPSRPLGEWEQVRQILDAAAGFGAPRHDGQGRFWNLPLQDVLRLSVYNELLIAPPGPDRGRNSKLVKALKGEVPFDGSDWEKMPLARPPVSPDHIAFIEDWIDRGCPEGPVD